MIIPFLIHATCMYINNYFNGGPNFLHDFCKIFPIYYSMWLHVEYNSIHESFIQINLCLKLLLFFLI